MSSVLRDHNTENDSDQRAYVIRNLNRIENRTEFFELVAKDKSTVKFNADRIAINSAIDISPENYNNICKSVFIDGLNKMNAFKNQNSSKIIQNKFLEKIPVEDKENFQNELKEIEKLPLAEQKDALKKILPGMSDQDFNQTWESTESEITKNIKEDSQKLIKNLKAGVLESSIESSFEEVSKLPPANQKAEFRRLNPRMSDEEIEKSWNKKKAFDNFKKLEDLTEKSINGTITDNEKAELKNVMDECSRHRKENFFSSSKSPSIIQEKTLEKQFDKIQNEKKEALKTSLARIENLPLEEQKEALKELFPNMTREEFEKSWKDAKNEELRSNNNAFKDKLFQKFNKNEEVLKKLKKSMPDISKLSPHQQKDALKNLIPNMPTDEFEALWNTAINDQPKNNKNTAFGEKLIDKSLANNKEAVKNSLRDISNLPLDQQRNAFRHLAPEMSDEKFDESWKNTIDEQFKDNIKTFTNARNERLCYRINVERVQNFYKTFFNNHPYHHCAKSLLNKANMKLGDYDRLNRVLDDYESKGIDTEKITSAAFKIAEDPRFEKNFKSPKDIASITEFINTELVLILSKL
jgi:hypothetical protein